MPQAPYGSVVVDGLRVFAYHGVDPQETVVGNTFEVSLRVDFNAEAAMRTDRVDLTISYADLTDIIRKEMQLPSKLLENVAFRIYEHLQHRYPHIRSGFIAIYKLQPPIRAEIRKAGFEFVW
ncbi:MAG: dihydroneopterin aldolase [Muribaculaceae bacterium]|nr:dihydroneopterin aldolase [Muribaculaceae bacterium]MDE6525747.1 dihydroneopterin aldolase [Muribaculaceae bacterium]MDE6611665.1 dihydroneopterin aldolase [Muribaculaceae bacterium]